MVAQDQSLFFFPTLVKWAYYISNIMLTHEDLLLLHDTLLRTLLEHLQGRGWVVNPWKIWVPSTIVKFWGVICSSNIKVVPETVIVKEQAYLATMDMEEVQTFVEICGVRGLFFLTWHSAFIPYTTWDCVGLKIRVASHLWEGKNVREAD